MQRYPNPELDRIILDTLAEKYKLLERREGIHLSTLNYCLTKSYFDQVSPLPPSDTELLLFATGYALQEVLTPSFGEVKTFERDGILYRPDSVFPVQLGGAEALVEIKSTRSGVKRYQEGNFPDTWITYMMGGCYIRNTTTYNLAVIYLAERPTAKILSETIVFDEAEIKQNWLWLIERRDIYKEALRAETVPTPFKYCATWQCDSCRYKTVCDAITIMSRKEQVKEDIKELWP